MAENKMEQVAAMFGKKLGERFLAVRNGCVFSCSFTKHGFTTYGAFENPYVDVDNNVLAELITGAVVIFDE